MNKNKFKNLRICFVKNKEGVVSETFIRAQESGLPCLNSSLYGEIASDKDHVYLNMSVFSRIFRKVESTFFHEQKNWDITKSYQNAFKHLKPDVVVAQYGPVGVRVAGACEQMKLPLIVYFRGYDAHDYSVLTRYADDYKKLFKRSFAIIAVSQQIKGKLIDLGADPAKIHYQPSGVDCNLFQCANPGENEEIFLAIGRLVEKKAPHLALLAFHAALKTQKNLKLRFIGDGPLRGVCRDLVTSLKLEDAVTFLGDCPHDVVVRELSNARAFLQHSVKAYNGDSEGTPNSVMEASASGLPVIATRHAGINDVVIDGKTGFLVDEFDIDSMSKYIVRLAMEPKLANEFGRAGREYVKLKFCRDESHKTLYELACKAYNS